MSSYSVGDEVRFRTSPDVIDDAQHVKSQSWTKYTPHPSSAALRDRRYRLQAVVNAKGLIELNLSNKELRDLPKEVFSLLRLEVLRLGGNHLHSLSSAISHLHKLRVLDLHKNQLHSLPETLTNCIHLQELYLAHNRLSSLPASLSHLHHLKVLSLAHNHYESLPQELGDLEALQSLDLSANKLWHLPYSIQDLRHLRALNLADNLFEQLPITVCYLPALQALNLRKNKLINLPSDFDALKGLQELSLGQNRLETMPYVIPHLSHLHSLDLSHNKLKSLPHRIAKLPKLRVLLVNGNKITSLPNDIETLEYLNTADNSLHNFSVARMKRLRYLNANHNQLENIPLGVYNLRNLEELRLNTNRISYLSQDVVLLKRLRTLDLGNNHLTSLPHGITELERLETFNIKGNKIESRHLEVTGRDQERGHSPHRTDEDQQLGVTGRERGPSPHRTGERRHSPDITEERRRGENHSHQTETLANIRGGNPDYQAGPDHPHGPEAYPETRGRQAYSPHSPAHSPHRGRSKGPNYKKKTLSPKKYHKPNWRDKFTMRRKVKSSKYPPHHRNTSTQYTPKGSVKSRGRPPLDYKPSANSLPSFLSLPPSKHSHTHTNGPGHANRANGVGANGIGANGIGERGTRERAGTKGATPSLAPTAVMKSNPLSVSEISYPMGSAPLHPQPSTSTGQDTVQGLGGRRHSLVQDTIEGLGDQRPSLLLQGTTTSLSGTGETLTPNGHIQAWSADPPGPPSIHSDTVTVNSVVGDELSLGDEDYEYQPTTVADDRLISVCDQVESMLNKQLLQPFTQTRGIFRKGMNEVGTLRTLNSITSGSLRRYPQGETAVKVASSDGVVHLTPDTYLKSHQGGAHRKHFPGGLSRSRRDAFKATPAGGLYRSTTDPKVTIYFPVNAVESPMTFTMQIEQVSPSSVERARLEEPHTDNLIAVGDIVHFKLSRRINFLQQVTLTIPVPQSSAKGQLHLLVYREDNTCSPSSSHYTIHHGYITLHAWHISGIGAVITRSKSKYKACRSAEHLLKYLYV